MYVCVCVCVWGGVICIINTSAYASARKNLKDEVKQANNVRSRSLGSVGIWVPVGPMVWPGGLEVVAQPAPGILVHYRDFCPLKTCFIDPLIIKIIWFFTFTIIITIVTVIMTLPMKRPQLPSPDAASSRSHTTALATFTITITIVLAAITITMIPIFLIIIMGEEGHDGRAVC